MSRTPASAPPLAKQGGRRPRRLSVRGLDEHRARREFPCRSPSPLGTSNSERPNKDLIGAGNLADAWPNIRASNGMIGAATLRGGAFQGPHGIAAAKITLYAFEFSIGERDRRAGPSGA